MMGLRFITSDVKNAYFKIHLTLFLSFWLLSCEAVAFAVAHGLIVKIERSPIRQPSLNESGRELNKRGWNNMFEVVYSRRPVFHLQSEVLFVSVETVHTLPALVDSHCSRPKVRCCQKQRQSVVSFMSPVVRGLICLVCLSVRPSACIYLSVCLPVCLSIAKKILTLE